MEDAKKEELDTLLDESLKDGYLPTVWFTYLRRKSLLNDWDDAENRFEQAISLFCFDTVASPSIWTLYQSYFPHKKVALLLRQLSIPSIGTILLNPHSNRSSVE